MPSIRFYDAKISWRNIFSASSLCQEQRQFSLSGKFSDYNNILITMRKDAEMQVMPLNFFSRESTKNYKRKIFLF